MGFSIASVGPDGGRIYHGAAVTVTGTDFGAAPGVVKIAGVAQTVVSWADTEIVFTVNAPAVGSYTLTIDRAA